MNLTPSPELDRRIAEQIMGWTYEPTLKIYHVNGEFKAQGGWSPSTNLDHAWEAAESVGLWEQGWWIAGTIANQFVGGVCLKSIDESTPALAICAAIEEVCKVQV